jgi:hypothetical protein
MDATIRSIIRGRLRAAAKELRDAADGTSARYTPEELIARAEEVEGIAEQELFTKRDVIELFRPIVEANDEIQELVSTHNYEGSSVLLKKLSDLDWAIRNAGVKNG